MAASASVRCGWNWPLLGGDAHAASCPSRNGGFRVKVAWEPLTRLLQRWQPGSRRRFAHPGVGSRKVQSGNPATVTTARCGKPWVLARFFFYINQLIVKIINGDVI